jgi:hypothetical protein
VEKGRDRVRCQGFELILAGYIMEIGKEVEEMLERVVRVERILDGRSRSILYSVQCVDWG